MKFGHEELRKGKNNSPSFLAYFEKSLEYTFPTAQEICTSGPCCPKTSPDETENGYSQVESKSEKAGKKRVSIKINH